MVENEVREEKKSEKEAMLYEKSMVHLEEGQIVNGKIISVSPSEVIVDIGYKSEGIIPRSEFRSSEKLEVGDSIQVLLEAKEDEDGMVVLSREKVQRALGWENILNNYQEGDIIEGRITKKIKGGFMVDIGTEAFLPASQAALREAGNSAMDQQYEFKILKINKMRKNVVLSRKSALYQKREEEKKKVISSLEKNSIVKGVVKNITDF